MIYFNPNNNVCISGFFVKKMLSQQKYFTTITNLVFSNIVYIVFYCHTSLFLQLTILKCQTNTICIHNYIEEIVMYLLSVFCEHNYQP